MPLKKGSSKKATPANVRSKLQAKKAKMQAVASAVSKSKKAKKK